MSNLSTFPAKLCPTAVGFLIHHTQILLVHHKKANIWLAPGGHIDQDELPHQAAEREFYEETGIQVASISPKLSFQAVDSEYLPNPIFTNLHWISHKNYQRRRQSQNPNKRHISKTYPLGCEQHYVFAYLVKPKSNNLSLHHQTAEVHEAKWFTPDEISALDTTLDIKEEILFAFDLSKKV